MLSILSGVFRVVIKLSTRARQLSSSLATWVWDAISQRGLDTPALLLQLSVGASGLALAALFWSFWDYGAGFLFSPPFISDAPIARLSGLRPSQEAAADIYGLLIDGLLLTYLLTYVRITSWARQTNSPLPRMSRTMALLVPALAILMWQLPYRVVYQNTFERVDFENVRCYRIGENQANLLLHCPDVQPPRNRVVARSNASLRYRGVDESIFVPSEQSHPNN